MAGENRSNVTVTVNGVLFDAYSAHAGISALPTSLIGMPSMGSVEPTISFQIDLNNQSTGDELFNGIKSLFDLCNRTTKEKIVKMKLEFWKDQTHSDAHLTLSFDGWVSSWHIASGNGANHVLAVSLTPKLDQQQFLNIALAN